MSEPITIERNAFWKSSGFHLVERNADGYMAVTADFMRAYYTRPEIHPVEDSCENEHRLFERLMADPFATVSEGDLDAIADKDAQGNYRVILDYRARLMQSGTIEGAYLSLFQDGKTITIPPLFIDQLAHLVMRNVMDGTEDPMQLRAAEIFFRDQKVTTDEGQLIFADAEIVEMRQKDGGFGGLGALVAEAGTPLRDVTLDIITLENAHLYWTRSDRFDMAVDFRFTEPANDAFARVVEKFVRHFFRIEVQVQPLQSIKDTSWRYHIGLDAAASSFLNALYEGDFDFDQEQSPIAGLFQLTFVELANAAEGLDGKPVYLGLAVNSGNEVKMKPQNLLTNLPIRR